jgi:threonine dehydratase
MGTLEMQKPELFTRSELESTAKWVKEELGETPTRHWPLLSDRLGTEVWVKHENHGLTGSFKVRGGLFYLAKKRREDPTLKTVVAATRGNHGQSVALAASRLGLNSLIIVPKNNNPEKNASMVSLGTSLVEVGQDFQEAYEYARNKAAIEGWHLVPSFDLDLLPGVASYAIEFFRDAPSLDVVYVPVGLGSGICSVAAARDALGLRTRIIGVVSSGAPAYAHSFEQKKVVETGMPETLADGLAVRVPDPQALGLILKRVEKIVQVNDDQIAQAMSCYFTDTHNIAEGAGAASLAAALAEREKIAGSRVGLVLSGGNVDRATYVSALKAKI